jgi:hypothetical protein
MLEGTGGGSAIDYHRGRSLNDARDVGGMLTGQSLESFRGLVGKRYGSASHVASIARSHVDSTQYLNARAQWRSKFESHRGALIHALGSRALVGIKADVATLSGCDLLLAKSLGRVKAWPPEGP